MNHIWCWPIFHGLLHCEKTVQFLHLCQFLSNYRGWRLHTWHMLTSVEDQQKAVNHIGCWPIFHGSLHLEKSVHFLHLGQFLSNCWGLRLHTWHKLTFGEDQQKGVNRIWWWYRCISWSSDFTQYLQHYFIDLHHALDICLVWHYEWPHNTSRSAWPIFHGTVILLNMSQFERFTSYLEYWFVGQCELYFTVQRFCLISPALFDGFTSYLRYRFNITLCVSSKYL